MVSDYDAVVVGAGHNGLVCGAYLAKQGLKICVVERRDVIGGACATEEIWPGFRASIAAYNLTLLQPKIMLDLELLDHGLEVIKTPPLFEPFPDGGHILLWDDPQKTAAELAKFSQADAAQYPALSRASQKPRALHPAADVGDAAGHPVGLAAASAGPR